MTDGQKRRINKGHALTAPFAGLEVGTERHQCFLHQLHKPGIAHDLRERPAQMPRDVAQKIVLERAIAGLMKGHLAIPGERF